MQIKIIIKEIKYSIREFTNFTNYFVNIGWLVGFMVFIATFNNISFISWQSVLLVEETGGPEKTSSLPQVTDKLYHIMLYTLSWAGVEPTTSVAIGTDCIGSCISNYHTITATTVPIYFVNRKQIPWTVKHFLL